MFLVGKTRIGSLFDRTLDQGGGHACVKLVKCQSRAWSYMQMADLNAEFLLSVRRYIAEIAGTFNSEFCGAGPLVIGLNAPLLL